MTPIDTRPEFRPRHRVGDGHPGQRAKAKRRNRRRSKRARPMDPSAQGDT